jgi:hypothetical protein
VFLSYATAASIGLQFEVLQQQNLAQKREYHASYTHTGFISLLCVKEIRQWKEMKMLAYILHLARDMK